MDGEGSMAPGLAALLARRRDAAEARLVSVEQVLAQVAGFRDSAGGDDEHDPEGVPLSEEWSRLSAQREGIDHELRAIAAAEQRLADGVYGVCIDCGRSIPVERLEVLPFAERCVPCAEGSARR